MGTNYYIWLDKSNDAEQLHIGKSSMGWVFSLRVYPERGIANFFDWMKLILDRNTTIRDEYGIYVSAHQMLETIVCRSAASPPAWNEVMYKANHGMPGPNNLVRGIPFEDSYRFKKPGEGTWDYCNYEFF